MPCLVPKVYTVAKHKNSDLCAQVFDASARSGAFAAQMDSPTNINIETIRRCNGSCRFCPASVESPHRIHDDGHTMSPEGFSRVCDELSRIGFSNRISLYGTNEPLLDDFLTSRVAQASQACPEATIRVMTNGRLLTLNKAEELFAAGLHALDVSIYRPDPYVETVAKQLKQSPWGKSVRIFSRSRNAVLFNRAGWSPHYEPESCLPLQSGCCYPFLQCNISSRLLMGQCCYDYRFEGNWGNLWATSFEAIWNGPRAQRIRLRILKNDRTGSDLCHVCDYPGTPRDRVDSSVSSAVRDAYIKQFPRDCPVL